MANALPIGTHRAHANGTDLLDDWVAFSAKSFNFVDRDDCVSKWSDMASRVAGRTMGSLR